MQDDQDGKEEEEKEGIASKMSQACEELAWITKEISKIYLEHNPEKLADILTQLRTKYAGQERDQSLQKVLD